MKKHIAVLCVISILLISFLSVCYATQNQVLTKEYKFPDIYWWETDRYGKKYLVEHYAVREITQATNIKVISRISRWNF